MLNGNGIAIALDRIEPIALGMILRVVATVLAIVAVVSTPADVAFW